ncbi:MAG TPA: SusC/RagA family TonB-linked outer membrane protein, partial [Sphingobacteriaceae bacterium]|nr:SusC/RagA family TonB-linked outer membrane protein [Sphingobacteriaceae bacterium]
SGSNEKSDYYVSLGYLNERGFMIRSNYERFNARVNINTQATDWLKTGLNINGTTIKSQMARDGSSTGYVNPFYFSRNMGPIYPVYAHDPATGEYLLDANGDRIFDIGGMSDLGLPARGPGGSNGRHVVQETLLNEDFFERSVLSARAYAEITFLNDFKFTTNVAMDGQGYLGVTYDNKIVGDGAPAGRASRSNIKTTSYTINQLLSYSRTFNEDHYFEVLLGHENYDKEVNRQYLFKQNQVLDGNIEPDNFTVINSATGRIDRHRIESYFSRLNYTFQDKYSLSASYRTDGSSKFFRDVRWGNFWSLGGAWRIDEENFFNAGWVDMLKLRASYGEVGNDNLLNAAGNEDYYAWQALYDLGYNNANAPGILQASLTAADLLWESNNTFDIGVDFNFFRRLSGTVEYFHRQSENLLFRVPLSLTTGLTEKNQNIGSMFNRGFELQVAGDVVRGQDFAWNVNLNLSTYKNEFTHLPNEEQISGTKKYMVGKSIYDYWLREWAGVDPTDGAGLYRAENTSMDSDSNLGNRIINGDTLTTQLSNARYHYAGTAIPDFSGGITNTFTYKNFTLSALLSFSVGGKTYDQTYASLMTADPDGNALHRDALNRWQNAGDVTDVPRMDNVASAQTNGQSDRWLVDASYLNFRSVSLNYEIPRSFLSRIAAQSANVYVSGENLGWISARKGMYVSQNFSGVTSNVYTPARVLTVGLNVGF